MYTDKNDFVVK